MPVLACGVCSEFANSAPWAGVPCARGCPPPGVAGIWNCGTAGPGAAGVGVEFLVVLSNASASTNASIAAELQS